MRLSSLRWLTVLLAGPLSGQQAPAPVIDTIFSTDTTVVLRYTVLGGSDVIPSIRRMDRSEGVWRRPRRGMWARTATGREDLAVIRGHEYCYIVTARLPGQRSPTQSERRCVVFSAGGPALQLPAAPGAPTVANRATHVLAIEFVDLADDETEFGIERRHADVSTWQEVRRLPAAEATGRTIRYSDSGLEMEQRYCYRVRVYNDDGDRLSRGVCATTEPAVAGEATVDLPAPPAIVRLSHPRDGELVVTWKDAVPEDLGEWFVTLRPLDGSESRSTRVRDRRGRSLTRWSAAFDGLNPDLVYCATVRRGTSGREPRPVCESPFADRSQTTDLGPDTTDLPRVAAVARPENGVIELRLGNAQAGQLVDVIRASDGRRWTDTGGRGGREAFRLDGLLAGHTYCFRLFVVNRFGSRYGPLQCEATRADPPGRPGRLRLDEVAGTFAHLSWGAAELADEYELSFKGTREAYTDHDGTVRGISGTGFEFEMRTQRSYCFTVRARNTFGLSDPSNRLCDVSAGDAERVVTFRADLVANIPPEGPIPYTLRVDPGPPAGARLRSILVIGNAATPYLVTFVKPDSDSSACTNFEGQVVEPGDALGPDGLNDLYGVGEPPTPVLLVACVARRDGMSGLIERVPVSVTYVRP